MNGLHLPFFGHGGDYNPDQWLDRPDILDEDIHLMKKAGCNLMSVGIFAWAALEPQEGQYHFDWLESILDRLHAAGIRVFLATPSGARPRWMSQKYPEVLRVREDGLRNLHGVRHNHCFTSPVYREFVRKIDTALAERFGRHPAVVGWHISNEYCGECHCELCQNAFRSFLKDRFKTLDALNREWWSGFWANTVTDWEQLHSPTPAGETHIHGLNLNWKRFVSHQTQDFMRAEIAAVRSAAPDLPVTTNMMMFFDGANYYEMSRDLDFTSFDGYPYWGFGADDVRESQLSAFNYDLMRSMKKQPFALMESTPSQVNWHEVCKLKKPGMHLLSSLHAVAHGADTVQYFQWRKSRGSWEKFHGAVVGHDGTENTRTFRDVAQLGEILSKMGAVVGSTTPSDAALIYDIETLWAVENSQGPRVDKHYLDTVTDHYRALCRRGINVDILEQLSDFDGYKLVIAPMLYLLKPDTARRLEEYASRGGTLVFTVRTGCVDQEDLCFLGGFPGPLRRLTGIWAEECDGLADDERNGIRMPDGKVYPCRDMCDLIHAETARVLGRYADDFYAGTPAFTVNAFGKGRVYYIASRPDDEFLDGFYQKLLPEIGIEPLLESLPAGVQVTLRESETERFLFVMNFSRRPVDVSLPEGTDMISEAPAGGEIRLPVNGIRVLCLPKIPSGGAFSEKG